MFTLVIDGTCLMCSQNLCEIIYKQSDQTTYWGDQQHYLYKEEAILKGLIVMSYVFESVAKKTKYI